MDGIEKDIKNENLEKKDGRKKKFKKIKVMKKKDIRKKLESALQREKVSIKKIAKLEKTIIYMNDVIEAYEKAVSELITAKEKLTESYEEELEEIKSERDLNYNHLTSLEATILDLYDKYQKSKEISLELKLNLETMREEKRHVLENLLLQEQRYKNMKNYAMDQLEIANQKLVAINTEHAIETTKLKAQLKKEKMARCFIIEQLKEKVRENEQLVNICDDLINQQNKPGNTEFSC